MGSSSTEPRSAPPKGLIAAGVLIALLFAIPFAYLVAGNIGERSALSSSVTSGEALPALGRSVLLAVTVSLLAMVVGTAAAWFVSRTNLPWCGVWRVLLPLPLVIPSFIGAFVLVAAFASGGLLEALLRPFGAGRLPAIRGFTGATIVLVLLTYPYVYMPVAARFSQLSASLEESARLLGARRMRLFFRVVLPQARGAILAGTLLVFLYTISDFGVVQLMRFDALTRVIYATRLFDRPTSLALSLQLGVLALAVVVIESAVTKGPRRTRGTARMRRPSMLLLGAWRVPAALFLAALVGAALIVPIGVLLWWSLRGLAFGAPGAGSAFGGLPQLVSPLMNTLAVSVSAAVTALLLVGPIAYLTVKYRSGIGAVANAVVVGGFALPGLAIALALVSFTVGAPGILGGIYQSLPLLVTAYVIHFGAQTLRASQVAVAAVPDALDDAARVLGVGRWVRLLRVDLPLMMPGLLAGAGIVLLSAMKELPATLLLAPAGFQTLAMDIWQATESAFFAEASVASLVLIALSGILTWLLVIRRAEVDHDPS